MNYKNTDLHEHNEVDVKITWNKKGELSIKCIQYSIIPEY